MKRKAIGLAVIAVSALGLGTVAANKARAYVIAKPDGVYAPLAFQFLVETGTVVDGAGRLLTRPVIDDLTYRPGDLRPRQVAAGSYETGGQIRPVLNAKPPAKTSPAQAQKAIQQITRHSIRFRKDVDSCEIQPPAREIQACVARALERFAASLEAVPQTAHSVVPVAVPEIRRAATRVRAARSVAQARAAVAEAAAVIRKSIALVKAGTDDSVRRLEVSQRSVIVDSLASAEQKLVRAIGI